MGTGEGRSLHLEAAAPPFDLAENLLSPCYILNNGPTGA